MPYQGQVRLTNRQHNQGILQIFWGYNWYYVCSTDLLDNCAPAVDSACRQLGYTGGSFKNAPRAESRCIHDVILYHLYLMCSWLYLFVIIISQILGFTSQNCKRTELTYRCLPEQFDNAIPFPETCDTSAHIICGKLVPVYSLPTGASLFVQSAQT